MSYEVYWLQVAVDQLLALALTDKRAATRVSIAIRTFGRERRGDVKKLEGSRDTWRLRSGDWRIEFETSGQRLFVRAVANCRDAYR